MNYKKQVDKSHYEFDIYMPIQRWCSVWHQLDEIHKLKPENVLEVGPGLGFLKALSKALGFTVETIDIDPDLNPDYVGSATNMPFNDFTYDVVCAFQMLEHIPYESSLKAFSEMVRVSRRNVLISLPDVKSGWRFQFHLSRIGGYDVSVSHPLFIPQEHKFDGEHYWEINKRGYPLARVIADLSVYAKLITTYRAREFPFHRFFVFERFKL
jgi:predicted SAM-dependent methyltransferase